MSKKILKALMQLFAIISPFEIITEQQQQDSEKKERKRVVKTFLERLLNQEQVDSFMAVFDGYYEKYIEELQVRLDKAGDMTQEQIEKLIRRIYARRAVKVLTICSEINMELDQEQKIIFLFQLLEFIKGESGKPGKQELAYVDTVADTFLLPKTDYQLARSFVLSDQKLRDASGFLTVNGQKEKAPGKRTKHLYRTKLTGEIRVIYIRSTGQYFIKYMGGAEVYMNGQLLKSLQSYPFTSGTSIRNQNIDPVYYSDVVSAFVKDEVKSKIVFEARKITYKFKDGGIGLNDVGFSEQSGRMVGIMGASGSGKTTLMNVLNGAVSPNEGQVLINDIDINRGDPGVKGLIGFVAQDDLLIEELSVYQNLYYNAKLCFDNYSDEQLADIVESTLTNLGLAEIKDTQVGSPLNKKISGGQRKRLNIALELIREPAVLFLDEPTSGLSSRDSENILDLLKELSLKGKLVFVVIHQPSSHIFKMFDRLLILDTGGFLIYNGNPIDSISYFKSRLGHPSKNASSCTSCGNVNPEQIFNIVETCVLNENGKLTHTRKISPREWQMHFRNISVKRIREKATAEDLPENAFKIPGGMGQFKVFLIRDILKKLSDRQYLFINLLEAPLLAFLLAFIIKFYNASSSNPYGYNLAENINLPIYIFMSVIVALFMGLTVSAEEIIKDRKLLKREAFLNLSWSGYLLSKVAVQFILSAIQAITFVIIGNTIMGIKGMYFVYWIVLFSTWTSANLLGLLISDSFKTVVTIYILIPFLVIPQIILSGVLVKYEHLNPKISSPKRIPFYGEMMTARWAFEGLATYQYKNNAFMKDFYYWEKVKRNSTFKSSFLLKDLQNKLSFIEENQENKDTLSKIESDLRVLRNQFQTEFKEREIMHTYYEATPTFSYPSTYGEQLYPEKLNDKLFSFTKEYLSSLQSFYKESAKIATDSINGITKQVDRDELRQSMRDHANMSLDEFVTNKNTFERLAEYDGELIQKTELIYLDPTSRFIKAHFYAPRKMVIGKFIPTLWVNVMVIWVMTFVLYVMLYFRILKRLLDFLERASQTLKK
ncbi:MAG: ATP-binding cassette domain-containing protein [Bacteroidota bacterium]